MHRTPRAVLVLTIIALCAPALRAQSVTIATPADIAARRNRLIDHIWGSAALPSRTAGARCASQSAEDCTISNIPRPTPPLPNLERVDLLKIGGAWNLGHRGRALHFVPQAGNGKLVIVHQGHSFSFWDDEAATDTIDEEDLGTGLTRLIAVLLDRGYAVAAVYMPRWKEALYVDANGAVDAADQGTPQDTCTASYEASYGRALHPHQYMFVCQESQIATNGGTGRAFQWFLDPTIVTINTLDGQYEEIAMTGLSGGGWTTTIVAAIDPRIGSSFPVAGSVPLDLYTQLAYDDPRADRETLDQAFYAIAGYRDLYVLGAYGAGRKQVQILNQYDRCCFGVHSLGSQAQINAFVPAVRSYESEVRTTLSRLGSGSFRVEFDISPPQQGGHRVSWRAAVEAIVADLDGGGSRIGGAPSPKLLVRGVDGTMWLHAGAPQSTAWVGSPYKTAGIAAAVENAASSLDLFFRSSHANVWFPNAPYRASYANGTWTRYDNELEAPPEAYGTITDLTAVSTGTGTYDAFAAAAACIKQTWVCSSDSQLYHWRYTGGAAATLAPVPGAKYVRGTPAAVSRGNTIDVFYIGANRALYDAHWNGSTWTISELPQRVRSFPVPVVLPDGTVCVYARDDQDRLVEYRRATPTALWAPPAVLSSQVQIVVRGTPSVVLDANGKPVVYIASAGRKLLKFTNASGAWTWSEATGVSLDGSPAARAGAVFFRGPDGSLRSFADPILTSLGGWFE